MDLLRRLQVNDEQSRSKVKELQTSLGTSHVLIQILFGLYFDLLELHEPAFRHLFYVFGRLHILCLQRLSAGCVLV